MQREFRVSLSKEQLTFSAAHFITFNTNICESLHGHNYRVRCDVVGPLNDDRYVIDFIALRDELQAIVKGLDHAVLLPTRHPRIKVEVIEDEVQATFEQRRWIFPRADCRLLPVGNTTAEELAAYIADRLIDASGSRLQGLSRCREMEVAVDENQGQWGCCTVPLHPHD